MSNQTNTDEVQQDSFPLKLPEPEVDPQQPWNDDLLERKQVADRLTNLIRHQSAPFVVSIDGYWGTGKTFLLKRWQKELEGKGFQSIYFNVWEDDFCDELLERVKHIFDVPNMVFVFGINRAELCSSLRSIYGEIDADIYLRRFFDMEFTLPQVDAETFCKRLMNKFDLPELFASLTRNADSTVHQQDFGEVYNGIPVFWSRFGLSLRDLDYCVRSVAFVGRSLQPRHSMHPWLLGLLIPLKIKNNQLYRRFISGRSFPSEVMDYVDDIVGAQNFTPDQSIVWTLDTMEALLYRAERWPNGQTAEALKQLELLSTGAELTSPEHLSKRTQTADEERASKLKEIMSRSVRPDISFGTVEYTANLIDLHQEMVRR